MGDLNAKFCVQIKCIAHSMPTQCPPAAHICGHWAVTLHTGATMWADMVGGGNVGFPGGMERYNKDFIARCIH